MITNFTFVNQFAYLDRATIVLFQKNSLACDSRPDIVLHAIRYCGLGWTHPITFPREVALSISDEFGNFSPRIRCDCNNLFEVKPTVTGRALTPRRPDGAPDHIVVTNRLPRGAVNIDLFRGDRVVARHSALPPMQTAHFRLDPDLWIGTTTVSLGNDFIVPVPHLDSVTRLSIRNIARADIVMTAGASFDEPLRFELANINSG
jgi:hypothetical protein